MGGTADGVRYETEEAPAEETFEEGASLVAFGSEYEDSGPADRMNRAEFGSKLRSLSAKSGKSESGPGFGAS